MTHPAGGPRRARPLAAAACGAALLALAAAVAVPLRPQGADTVGGRLGALALACTGSLDLGTIDWIRAAADENRLPYFLSATPAGGVVSIYGPAPALLGWIGTVGLAPGARVGDGELQARARWPAAAAVALATAFLALALGAELAPLAAAAGALVAAGSFAGVATLGQGLWQQTAALPVLAAALAALTWGRHRPALLALVPGLAGLAVLLRPAAAAGLAAVAVAALVQARERRPSRQAIGLGLVALGALGAPLLLWNLATFGGLAPRGHSEAVALVASGQPVWSLAPLPFLARALALVASPFRGLLLWAPLVLVAIGAARRAAPTARVLAAGLAAQVLLIAAYFYWWGGVCFGPRLLAELVWIAPVALACRRRAVDPPAAPDAAPRATPTARRRLARGTVALAALWTVAVGLLGLVRYDPRAWELRHDPRQEPRVVWAFRDNPLAALLAPGELGPRALDAPPGPFLYCAPRTLTMLPAAPSEQ